MICLLLGKEHLRTSRVGVAKFIAKYSETRSLIHKPGLGHPSKITPEMKAIVGVRIREDNEALQNLLGCFAVSSYKLHLHALTSYQHKSCTPLEKTLEKMIACCYILYNQVLKKIKIAVRISSRMAVIMTKI